ncbi:thioredoxin family protein [Stieleria sp. ICT_E10.1]|uniref:thioredoxin family protein n=1 Tax=Stieleria sedimenti TaxID=2976331 RepID=UPI00217F8F2F|nr:thioredoxin family protein [Stieleria sedimenti]MCS7471126.1 thioredoxin family protein [Stieleria sedimenti]
MKILAPLAVLSFASLIYLAASSDFNLTRLSDSSSSVDVSGIETDESFADASGQESFDPNPALGSGSAPQLVLMKFGAPWCPPCRMIDKELRKLGRTSLPVEIRKIDVDERPEMAERYGVSSIPRLILLQDGRKIGDAVGYQSADELSEWINENASPEALAGKKRTSKSSVVQANPFFK